MMGGERRGAEENGLHGFQPVWYKGEGISLGRVIGGEQNGC